MIKEICNVWLSDTYVSKDTNTYVKNQMNYELEAGLAGIACSSFSCHLTTYPGFKVFSGTNLPVYGQRKV